MPWWEVGQISTGQEQFGYSPAWLKIKGGGRAGTGRDDCVIEYIEHDGVRDLSRPDGLFPLVGAAEAAGAHWASRGPTPPAIRSAPGRPPGRAGGGIAKLLKGALAIYRHAGCRMVQPTCRLSPSVGKLTHSGDTFACAG